MRNQFVVLVLAIAFVLAACRAAAPAVAPTVAPVAESSADAGEAADATLQAMPVNNAERVIAGLRGRFRSCYHRGIAKDFLEQGKVTFKVDIAPNGDVDSVNISSNTGLSITTTDCIEKALRYASFEPPGGSGSMLSVPVNLVQAVRDSDAGTAPSL